MENKTAWGRGGGGGEGGKKETVVTLRAGIEQRAAMLPSEMQFLLFAGCAVLGSSGAWASPAEPDGVRRGWSPSLSNKTPSSASSANARDSSPRALFNCSSPPCSTRTLSTLSCSLSVRPTCLVPQIIRKECDLSLTVPPSYFSRFADDFPLPASSFFAAYTSLFYFFFYPFRNISVAFKFRIVFSYTDAFILRTATNINPIVAVQKIAG